MTGYKSFNIRKKSIFTYCCLSILNNIEKNLLGKEAVVFRYVELTEIGRSGGKNDIGKT